MDKLRNLKVIPNNKVSNYEETHWYGSFSPQDTKQLYSWGANSHGQLGQSDSVSEQILKPHIVNICLNKSKVSPEDIKYIRGGGGHSFIIDKVGRVYACGNNCSGQLGIPDCDKSDTFQLVVSLLSYSIEDMCCGWDSTAALTKSGEVLVWGSNKYNQLGTPEISSKTNVPTLLNKRAKHIAMGLRHMALISDDGLLYTAGVGLKGQLGLLDESNNPLKTSAIFRCAYKNQMSSLISVACGQHHTLVLDRCGVVYGFGDNKRGQIDGSDKKQYNRPVKINIFLSPQKQIWAGWTHSAALSETNVLTLWGRNDYGQLTEKVVRNTAVIENIKTVALGSEHCLAISKNGKLFTWGWNEHGNCGTGDEQNVLKPVCLADDCTNIGVGYGCSYAVMDKVK